MPLESLRIQPLSHDRLVDVVSASPLECLGPLHCDPRISSLLGSVSARATENPRSSAAS